MNIAATLKHLYPDAVPNVDYVLVWVNGEIVITQWSLSEPQPTSEQLAEAWLVVEPQMQINAVRAKRASEYPPMADYLDAQVKKASADPAVVAEGELQESEYLSACQAVKAANPFS